MTKTVALLPELDLREQVARAISIPEHHTGWCHHCIGPDDLKPCDGGKAHNEYVERRDREEYARLKAKFGAPSTDTALTENRKEG